MFTISVRLPDKLLHDLDERANSLHVARGEYIRRAIEYMNADALKQERKNRLAEASLKVRKESMVVNAEFSKVEHDPKD